MIAALFVAGVIHRDLDLQHLYRSAVDGAIQTAVVMLLIATSALLGVYLTEQQIPQKLAEEILTFTKNPYAVLLILNVFFLILGLFLHSAAAIIRCSSAIAVEDRPSTPTSGCPTSVMRYS